MPDAAAVAVTPARGLTRRASLNGLALGADYIARLGVGLVLNPVLLSHLGTAMYGTWVVVSRLVSQVAPSGGRAGEALKWWVAREQSSTDVPAKRRQVGSAVVVWLMFLPILGGLGALVVLFAPHWLDVPRAEVGAVRLATALLVLNLVVAGLATLPLSVLQGENLGYRRLGLSTSMVLLGGLFAWVALELGAGMPGAAAAALVTTVLTGITYLAIVRTHVAWFGIAVPDAEGVRRFLRISWWFLLWNLVMLAMKGADLMVLGIAGSSTLAASYALSTYVPVAASDVVALAISSTMPGLGGLIGDGRLHRAAAVRGELMAVAWAVSTVATGAVLLWQDSFLSLWVGPGHSLGTAATVLIAVMVVQLAVLRTDANIIDLTLRLAGKVMLGLASVVLSVLLAWAALVRTDLGVAGALGGFVAGRLLLTLCYPLQVGRLLGLAPWTQVAAALRPAATTAAVLLATAWIGRYVAAGSWWVLIAVVTASTTFLAATTVFVGLSRRHRTAVLQRVRLAVRRGARR